MGLFLLVSNTFENHFRHVCANSFFLTIYRWFFIKYMFHIFFYNRYTPPYEASINGRKKIVKHFKCREMKKKYQNPIDFHFGFILLAFFVTHFHFA